MIILYVKQNAKKQGKSKKKFTFAAEYSIDSRHLPRAYITHEKKYDHGKNGIIHKRDTRTITSHTLGKKRDHIVEVNMDDTVSLSRWNTCQR